MGVLPTMSFFSSALAQPKTYKRSTQAPDPIASKAPSAEGDAASNKAADMVASNAKNAQSAAEDLKKTANAEAQPGLLDTMLGWVNSPSDVTVNAGDARDLIPKKERKEVTQDQFDQLVQNKYDDQKTGLPSWVSDAASVYSRLAEQSAARDADLRNERRESAAQAMQTVNAIPGISDAWARNNARTRGLTSIAGR